MMDSRGATDKNGTKEGDSTRPLSLASCHHLSSRMDVLQRSPSAFQPPWIQRLKQDASSRCRLKDDGGQCWHASKSVKFAAYNPCLHRRLNCFIWARNSSRRSRCPFVLNQSFTDSGILWHWGCGLTELFQEGAALPWSFYDERNAAPQLTANEGVLGEP
jgi:hypothetical protein